MNGARLRQTSSVRSQHGSHGRLYYRASELGQKPRDPGLPWRLAQGVGGGGGAHASPPAPRLTLLEAHANTLAMATALMNGSRGSNSTQVPRAAS